MLEGFRKWLSSKIYKPKYRREISEVEITPEQIKKLPERFRKSYYHILGQRDRYKEKYEKAVRKLKEIKGKQFEGAQEIAAKMEKEMEKGKMEDIEYQWFETPIEVYSAYDGNPFTDEFGRVWSKWVGFKYKRMEESVGVKFVLENEEGETAFLPRKNYIPRPYLHFAFEGDLVLGLKKKRMGLWITHKGVFLPPQWKLKKKEKEETKEEPSETSKREGKEKENSEDDSNSKNNDTDCPKSENNQELIDLRKQLSGMSKDNRELFLDLWERYQKILGKYRTQRRKAFNLMADQIENQIESESTLKMAEAGISNEEMLSKRLTEMSSRITPLIASESEARASAAGMEDALKALSSRLERLKDRLVKEERPEREKAMEEIKDTLDWISRRFGTPAKKPEREVKKS